MRLLAACLIALGFTSSALAQTSPVTLSPDGQFAIVQKDVGDQRWAIVQDRNNRTITGNVFSSTGGPAQFVWCDSIGGINYRCSGSSGCAQQPCQWSSLGNVTLPDSFFSVPGGQPTPRPSSVPTPRPTNPPATGLQGLIGTWDLTFKIISTFTFTYRLQRYDTTSLDYPAVVGRNAIGDVVVVGRVQDIDPGNALPYDYALAEISVGVCQLYVFDQTGTDRVSGLHSSAFQQSNGDCGTLLGADAMTGVRVSRTASVDETASAASVKRALKRQGRALRAEARDRAAAAADGADELLRALQGAARN